jgi:type IX secretion system PorP/SprF family membrane protein
VKVIKQIWIVGLLFCAAVVQAQDIHFSQFNFSPLNTNPSNTGLFDGDYRFVANYKNQWPTVPVRYNTFSASAEMNFVTLSNNDRFGGGLVFFFDRAGDSRFTTLNTALSLSYDFNFGKNSVHHLVYGIQFGLVNRNFNYDKLSFDNQWNGDNFNPNTPIDENFSTTRLNFFDLNHGLTYMYKKNERNNFTIGFSGFHVNSPRVSFFNNSDVKLNPRFGINTRGQVKVAKRVDLVPEVLFQIQDNKYEIVFGLHSKYYIPLKSHVLALNTGMYGRALDAGWIHAGIDYDNLQFNFTYDVNFSKLNVASRYNGGFEGSVIYVLSKVKKINKPGSVCPAFL